MSPPQVDAGAMYLMENKVAFSVIRPQLTAQVNVITAIG